MGNKLYVGNLPYQVRDSDLEQAFGQFGAVTSAKVMMDRDTGRSKGFGFVEMGSDAEAQAAITGMNGQPMGGRSVVVNEARPMEQRRRAAAASGRRWRWRWRWWRYGGAAVAWRRRWPARRRRPAAVAAGRRPGRRLPQPLWRRPARWR